MEKVKVTQGQADAIESLIADHGHKYDRFIREIADDRNWFTGSHEPIRKMEIEVFARALYRGYEVEPEFKAGDWVFNKKYNRTAKINLFGVDEVGARVDDFEFNNIYQLEDIRYATPEEISEEKQRRWWKKHDREPWELREDDILDDGMGGLLVVDKLFDGYSDEAVRVRFKCDSSDSLYNVKDLYTVVCFAKDRKDV